MIVRVMDSVKMGYVRANKDMLLQIARILVENIVKLAVLAELAQRELVCSSIKRTMAFVVRMVVFIRMEL